MNTSQTWQPYTSAGTDGWTIGTPYGPVIVDYWPGDGRVAVTLELEGGTYQAIGSEHRILTADIRDGLYHQIMDWAEHNLPH